MTGPFLKKGKILQNIDRNKMRVLPWMLKNFFFIRNHYLGVSKLLDNENSPVDTY